ncbi:Zinc Finger Mym-Type Protein 4 [Manis pentadactyla]|nr:Zinc Finger Mym-Type Protein 4 [Manis pentadactyla]
MCVCRGNTLFMRPNTQLIFIKQERLGMFPRTVNLDVAVRFLQVIPPLGEVPSRPHWKEKGKRKRERNPSSPVPGQFTTGVITQMVERVTGTRWGRRYAGCLLDY